MRPRTIDEFVGQDHIMGEGRLLRRAIAADMLSSVIFAGPPGTGKTTLARVIANTTSSRFVSLNAVLSGVKEVRAEIEIAREQMALHQRRTILFVDEVHRWNKAQQDALLPWVESGTVVLIGATTENPFFEVNAALVSRSRIFQLRPLSEAELRRVMAQALQDPIRGYGSLKVTVEPDAADHLIAVADGDARSLLNAVQLAVETSVPAVPTPPDTEVTVSLAIAEESIQAKALLYDREGDYHYDTISAFIKSLRGSDPDAALYWMARMVASGEDPRFLFRRMLILASEDVGLADPQALVVVEAAARAFDRVGLPEGQFHLAQAALYLATCAKSNSTLGYFDARASVEAEASRDVPRHLRDGNRDKEGFGHGEGYLYPHAYRDHWVAQAYLPSGMQGRLFYTPSRSGYEGRIADDVERRREVQLSVVTDDDIEQEILTFSPPQDARERWLVRLSQSRNELIQTVRDRVFAAADLQRHERVLIAGSRTETLVWEAVRCVPEGLVAALVDTPQLAEQIAFHAEKLDALTRPLILIPGPSGIDPEPNGPPVEWPSRFELLIGRNWLHRRADRVGLLRRAAEITDRIVLAEPAAAAASRLSEVLGDRLPHPERALLEAAEQRIYGDPNDAVVNWRPADIGAWLSEAGFEVVGMEPITHVSTRVISPADVTGWLTAEGSRLGAAVAEVAGTGTAEQLTTAIIAALGSEGVRWRSVVALAWGRTPDSGAPHRLPTY
ncbi:MAG: AAA family ATPase [Spirochaetaceae bacterium]|nr:MAG: AAA family ATPase [Spirochaetaceae bacterium]